MTSSVLQSQVTISTSATHSSQITGSEAGIIIQSGVTLTIDGGLWKFNETKKIELQSGAHLIVQNGVTLEKNSSADHWIGIEAIGNPSLDQYLIEPNEKITGNVATWEGELLSSQTSVIINSGCIISNAQIGIFSDKGAIVRARSSQFIDNEVGISLVKYESGHHPKFNASYMMDCEFKWNTINNELNNFNLIGIYLNTVRGVNIGGCTFENNFGTVASSNYAHRGIGISINYSTAYISQSGNTWCDDDEIQCPTNCYDPVSNSVGNNFKYLYKGIVVLNHDFEPVGIRNSTFFNCATGITLNGTMGVVIYDNTFDGNSNDLNNYFEDWLSANELAVHLNVDNAKAFTIYNNNFLFSGKNIHSIRVNESQYYNSKIWECTIVNTNSTSYVRADNVYGIWLGGDCHGLGIQCSSFENQGVDWLLSTGGDYYTRGHGVLKPILMGYHNTSSSNVFSLKIASRYSILIESGGVNYNPISVRYVYVDGAAAADKPKIITVNDPYSEELDIVNNANAPDCQLNCDQLASIQQFQTKEFGIKIFPNPSSTRSFTISTEGNEVISEIMIFNNLGQKISKFKLDSTNLKVWKVSEISSGLYFVQVVLKNNFIDAGKILVE